MAAASDTKAEDIVVLDLTGRISYADHIVLCSGSHPRHVAAIAQRILRALRDLGQRPLGTEGLEASQWALLDYGDFLIHIFDRSKRAHYDLDSLWADAPRLSAEDLGLETTAPLRTFEAQPFSTEG